MTGLKENKQTKHLRAGKIAQQVKANCWPLKPDTINLIHRTHIQGQGDNHLHSRVPGKTHSNEQPQFMET